MRQHRGLSPSDVPAPGAEGRRAKSTSPRRCSASRCRCRSCWHRPASPASPTPPVSWRWPGRRAGRAARTRCRPWAPARSRRWRRSAPGRLWFQVYVWQRPGPGGGDGRAGRGGRLRGDVLTVDTAVFGKRERDVRRGFTLPPKLGLSTLLDGIVHPGWTWRFLRDRADRVRQRRRTRASATAARPSRWPSTSARQFDPALSWSDVEWLRSCGTARSSSRGSRPSTTPGSPPRRASRQSPSPITVAASSTRRPPPLDPGRTCRRRRRGPNRDHLRRRGAARERHRQGGGARAPPPAWPAGPICTGWVPPERRGVDHVLDLFASDMRRTMALVGCRTIKELDREYVDLGA